MIYLFFTFFVCLLISQSLMDMASALIILVCLCRISFSSEARKDMRLVMSSNRTLVVLSTLWFLNLAISYFLSPVSSDLWLRYLSDLKYLIFSLSLIIVFKNLRLDKRLFFGMVVIVLALTVLQIPEYFLQYGEHRRLNGFYGNPMTLAHGYGFIAIFIFFYSILFIKHLTWRPMIQQGISLILSAISAITLVALLILIYLTMTRGVWLALFISLPLVSFFYSRRWFIAQITSFLTLSTVLLMTVPKFKTRLLHSFAPENSDQIRWNLWAINWDIIKSHPLWGVGYGQNTLLVEETFNKLGLHGTILESHAHNQFIHWTAGTGFLGLIIIVSFFVYILARNFTTYKKANSIDLKLISLAGCCYIIYFFIGGIFESNFEHSKLKYMLTFILTLNTLFSSPGAVKDSLELSKENTE